VAALPTTILVPSKAMLIALSWSTCVMSTPAALAQAVSRTKANGHGNLADLLKTTTADLVVLTTPSGLHPEQAIQVAASGRPCDD
jgi:predicted dehydrogenase